MQYVDVHMSHLTSRSVPVTSFSGVAMRLQHSVHMVTFFRSISNACHSLSGVAERLQHIVHIYTYVRRAVLIMYVGAALPPMKKSDRRCSCVGYNPRFLNVKNLQGDHVLREFDDVVWVLTIFAGGSFGLGVTVHIICTAVVPHMLQSPCA